MILKSIVTPVSDTKGSNFNKKGLFMLSKPLPLPQMH